MSNWMIYNKKCDIKKISEDFNISPLLVRILANRDIKTNEDIKLILSSDLSDLHDERLLPNIDKAIDLIIDKIKNKKSIRIIGDYDIDGVCATYILYDAIKNLGGVVSFYIPHRVNDGYGINVNIIDSCIKDKIDTIITCDNGISASKEIEYAKKHGMTIIVTDHHEVSSIPKDADCIVNPKLSDSKYPYKDICGTVVAWKVVKYLYKILGENIDIDKYLEFACIATIGDIMPLQNENHIIAKLGLKKIANTSNKGLKKLLYVSNMINKELNSYHIGFIIGPLINAAGRLSDASLAIRLFISNDDKEIDDIAYELKKLNDERKNITEKGVKEAIELVEKEYRNDKVLLIYLNDINESVCGIIAGRIKDIYNKPTIVLSDTIDNGIIKASGRSIDKYDMFSKLSNHKDMFTKFGGHKGAAGFSMYKNDLDILRQYLNNECGLEDSDLVKKVYIDVEVPIYEISENIIEDIKNMEPYGYKLEKPTFACRDVECFVDKVYGEKQNVLKMCLKKDGKRVKGILFKNFDEYKSDVGDTAILNILYNPTINEFNGIRNVEIDIRDYKAKNIS